MSASEGGIDRREAIRRVTFLLGGATLVGGSALLEACEKPRPATVAGQSIGTFTPQDVAYLDEVADTILPRTKTPGAKDAKVGPFMALMVTDTYEDRDQKIFRDGMAKLEDASQKMNGAGFMASTPAQRLALLQALDREQKAYTDAREAAQKKRRWHNPAQGDTVAPDSVKLMEQKKLDAYLPDQRKENAPQGEAGGAPAVTGDAPSHYFRMMKELALLGYFTSEIGYTQAMRYVESPGRYDPCVPYYAGERAWAPHA